MHSIKFLIIATPLSCACQEHLLGFYVVTPPTTRLVSYNFKKLHTMHIHNINLNIINDLTCKECDQYITKNLINKLVINTKELYFSMPP